MTVNVYKPEINLREKFNELDVKFGRKGLEVAKSNTIDEVFDAVGAGRRNLFINGSFDIWQRGTSFSGQGFVADRWYVDLSGATSTTTRESFAVGQRDVPGNPHYYLRTAFSAGNDRSRIFQKVEDVTRFSDVWVTISGWIRCSDAGAESPPLDIDFIYNDVNGTQLYDYGVGRVQPVEDWQFFSFTTKTIDVSTIGFSGDRLSSSFEVRFGQGGETTTTAYTWDFANIQLEYGKNATPFECRTIGEELTLCQRYYEKIVGSSPWFIAHGYGTEVYCNIPFNTSKRTGSGTLYYSDPSGVAAMVTMYGNTSGSSGPDGLITGIAPSNVTAHSMSFYFQMSASTYTPHGTSVMFRFDTNHWIAYDVEL
jgi:hypothetical protein